MAFTSFHHGTRLQETSETPVLVQVSQSAVVGLLGTAPDADADTFPLNTPVLLAGDATLAASLGDTGTLKAAVDDVFDQVAPYTIVIRVEEGADDAETLSNLVGDATARTGVHALLKSLPVLGMKPRLIAFPGYSAPSDPATLNPVVAELVGVLEELGAVAFVDGPDTTDAEAVTYQALIGSERVYLVDPQVKVWDTATSAYVARPASARFAGVQARVDTELGFWHSLSNKAINGIGGVTREITYGTQSDYLNENCVGTIINLGSGYITWGNRGCGSESLWAFLAVRRTADFINEAMQKAYLAFVDKPFSKANLKFMLESGNAAMRTFKAQGAIIGGKVWIDTTLNEASDMAAGKITLSMEFEPPAPMEDIRFMAYRNIDYYLDLTKDALAAA
ncbi:phage tail sheath subtilisin-like domain-containing protein [Pseudooceanicola sp. CBS1P-1]|uniref:Phage tail protein n=1 Tax=Pseudooceanicola albus TaxID=2692189 RepID=A0A6L7FX52_9RHOB|nr:MULTISPECIES: phage tail sheath subtilisin-like domain-containing protein [Pseudooceanicola]MBT9383332.1 phage tail sheath subtilisin-like domain-containing protein [Pseudooceanicola endophyticus]MXN16345.1 phage tail protein [Pseudooceanicola albus]